LQNGSSSSQAVSTAPLPPAGAAQAAAAAAQAHATLVLTPGIPITAITGQATVPEAQLAELPADLDSDVGVGGLLKRMAAAVMTPPQRAQQPPSSLGALRAEVTALQGREEELQRQVEERTQVRRGGRQRHQ
jgi:hypothetical protein